MVTLIWDLIQHMKNSDAASQEALAATPEVPPILNSWNPTGNIFDLRPELARVPLSYLAHSILEMRRQLRSTNSSIDRVQLSQFERQYSNALWQRASVDGTQTVEVHNVTYKIIITVGNDVILLHTDTKASPSR